MNYIFLFQYRSSIFIRHTFDLIMYFYGTSWSNITISVYLHVSAVTVTLNAADQIDRAVETLKGQLFNGQPADVRHNPCNRLLCVADLPSNMDDAGFRQLMQLHGKIERCFLMRDSEG
jgi:hypothetical protein